MPPDGKNWVLARYTDNNATTWSLRVDATLAADADYGFGAYNGADPLFIRTPRNQPRKVVLTDANTRRTVMRPVGTTAANAWATTPFTDSVFYPGKATAVTYTRTAKVNERLAKKDQILVTLPEPAAD